MESSQPTDASTEISPTEEGLITPIVVSRSFTLIRMEAVQSILAYIFADILVGVIYVSFSRTGATQTEWGRTTALLDIFVPVKTSLLGSAVGFYFGQKVPGS